jgi:cytochrome c-type biogenesis protein CcmH/NrfG
MRKDAVIFGIAGVFFGLLVGWIIGSQQAVGSRAPQPASAPAVASGAPAQAAPALDEAKVSALKSVADRSPSDAETRVQLGNLYFDAERYDEATRWYEAAVGIDPKNVNASTDLGITYYYTNKPDAALAQFERSLAIDPTHSKTLLNVGIVRAFAKEDLTGAAKAWERVLEVAPNSPEARAAKQALDGLRSAHPGGTNPAPKSPGEPD